MHPHGRSYTLSFGIVDKLTEDANKMIELQKNKNACLRAILFDFVKVNGIVNNYAEKNEKVRLKKYFGYAGYSGYPGNTLLSGKKEDRRKCRRQFYIYLSSAPDNLLEDVFTMLYIQDDQSIFIREMFLDFVKANGIVADYADIPEMERLERFFGYVVQVADTSNRPCRLVRILQEKDFETRPHHHEAGTAGSDTAYTMPGGITVRVTVEQATGSKTNQM